MSSFLITKSQIVVYTYSQKNFRITRDKSHKMWLFWLILNSSERGIMSHIYVTYDPQMPTSKKSHITIIRSFNTFCLLKIQEIRQLKTLRTHTLFHR